MREAVIVSTARTPIGVAFKGALNNIFGIICDFPLAMPSAMAFRKYHLLHHKHLGQYDLDPDVVSHD